MDSTIVSVDFSSTSSDSDSQVDLTNDEEEIPTKWHPTTAGGPDTEAMQMLGLGCARYSQTPQIVSQMYVTFLDSILREMCLDIFMEEFVIDNRARASRNPLPQEQTNPEGTEVELTRTTSHSQGEL